MGVHIILASPIGVPSSAKVVHFTITFAKGAIIDKTLESHS